MPTATQQNVAARGSSVIDFTGAVASNGAITAASISASPWRTIRRIVFTAADLAQSSRLYDILYKIQDLIFQGISPLTSNRMLAGNALTNITFASGQTLYLPHGLGRSYSGWFVTRAQGIAAILVESAVPQGMLTSQVLPITSLEAGTYDLYVF